MRKSVKYIVYRHTSPSGKVYIGITKHKNATRRWENGKGYRQQTVFTNAIRKYGWKNIKHEIILANVSESEAKYAERYLIRWYKIHNISYNVTDGGDGCHGRTPWNKGLHCFEETKKKIGDANRGSGNYWWHKEFPEEMKRKISEAKKGIATRVRKVVQLTLSGEFIREWDSMSNAARALGLDASRISACCMGKRNKHGNFKWRYKDENTNIESTQVA